MTARVSNTTEKDENLETYCLIWLDTSVNKLKENIQAQEQLRSSINHLLTFEDGDQCLHYIHTRRKDNRIVLIVSEKSSRIIIPQIVSLRQLISIYIYCKDKKINEQWSLHFSKIKGIFIRLDELIHQIQTDQIQRQHNKIDESLAINIFNPNAATDDDEEQSSTGLNGQFIHSQLLIDCLIRMDSSSDERHELIMFCKQQYKNNPTELQIVEEFEHDYSSTRALWWYTRESFLYRLLNKALRVQNIDLLYLFRSFIRDLGQELENNKCSLPIHVYRSQQMSKEEIEILQNSIGEYISMNSFLSTSVNQQQARSFLFSTDVSDDIEQVFFEIDADPRLENIRPFSNITSLSYYPDEEEVLFMIGSIFRLVKIEHETNRIWNIRMELCSENDHQLQSLFQHMKNELGTGQTNLYNFGHVLSTMGKFDHAEKYFRLYLNQLSDDHPHVSLCYHALGRVTDDKGDYDSSLKWYNKSLQLSMHTLKSDHPDIGCIHNSIAIVYEEKCEYDLALESYEKALMIWKKVYGDDHPLVAGCLSNMGDVYQKENKCSKALQCYQKVLNIRQKHLPADHPDLGSSHNNIGNIHRCLDDYDLALEHFNVSLKIKSKSLPPHHPSIATTLENIGLVYECKDDFQQALSCYEKASKIYRYSLSSSHTNIIEIDQSIERVLSKLK